MDGAAPAGGGLLSSPTGIAAATGDLLGLPASGDRHVDVAAAVPTLILDALVRGLRGDTGAAETTFERALQIAETEGSVWPFLVTTARELLHLLRTGQSIPRHEPGAAIAEPSSDRSTYADELLDRISNGELRVLRLLPTHLSATEIGSELCLSVNTVKTHMTRIYQKLGVHRRTDAVRRGRELRLIRASTDQG